MAVQSGEDQGECTSLHFTARNASSFSLASAGGLQFFLLQPVHFAPDGTALVPAPMPGEMLPTADYARDPFLSLYHHRLRNKPR